jgi:hypothetical protein
MMQDLCPDDPEDRCPGCGGRIPDGCGIPDTQYYGLDDRDGTYTVYYCSVRCRCLSKR